MFLFPSPRSMHAARQYKAEQAAANAGQQKPSGQQHPAVTALQHGGLGVCFSGAGFGASYQLGASQVLEALGVLGRHTPVSGASAGGVVAAATRCGIPQLEFLDALKKIAQELLTSGQVGHLRAALRPELERLLPDNAHDLCSTGPYSSSTTLQVPGTGTSRSHNGASTTAAVGTGSGSSSPVTPQFVLAATRVRGCCPVCWQPDGFTGGFSNKQELIDGLLAGAYEPVVSDGRCWTPYRKHHYIDGGVRDPCPPIPGVSYTVIIYPVPHSLLKRVWPYQLMMHPPPPEAVAISPGQYGHPWPYQRSYKKSNKLVMHPQPPEVLNMLFERGRRDALGWAQSIGLTAAALQQLASPGYQRGSMAAAVVQDRQAASNADGARLSPDAVSALLAIPPTKLPMIVPVPDNLMHFL